MVSKVFCGLVVCASLAIATSASAGVGKFNGYWVERNELATSVGLTNCLHRVKRVMID